MIRYFSVLFFALMVLMNYLANALPLNGKTTGELSDAYPNLFVPAGITFSIWGVIYLLVAVYCLVQFQARFRETATQISWLFIASCILNAAWIFAWHYQKLGISLLVMLGLLATLIAINLQLKGLPAGILKATFGVYLGWICIATIANVTAVLVHAGWNGFGLSQESWTILMIATGTLIVAATILRIDNPYIGLAVMWAFLGIILKRNDDYRSIVLAAVAGILLVAAATAFKFFVRRLGAILTLALALLLVPSACTNPGGVGSNAKNGAASDDGSAAGSEVWIQLFNGENLDDWTPKFTHHELGENFRNTFRVEDSLLVVSYENWENFDGEFGHLFYKQPFSRYKIRVEYKFFGDQVPGGASWAYRNNGIMLHCQPPESMGLDATFPVSIEAQLLGGDGTNERTTGNVCTPGTHIELDGTLYTDHCFSSSSNTYPGDQWVRFEAVVLGDSIIHHIVEGDTVLTYTHPVTGGYATPDEAPYPEGMALTKGYISIQAESGPTA
ncbi:MAG: family 16 glycoside hydrolase [Bacteroidales bacterium]